MNRKHHKTLPGRYRLTLLFGKRPGMGKDTHRFDVTLHVPGRDQPLTEKIARDRMPLGKTFDVRLSEPGNIQVILTPTDGKSRISGLMLEPIQ